MSRGVRAAGVRPKEPHSRVRRGRPEADGMRTCSKCRMRKPPGSFSPSKSYTSADGTVRNSRADGLSSWCKTCTLNCNLKRAYNATVEDFWLLADEQCGRCAVCEEHLAGDRSTHLDHNHETGALRGLLCARCNSALGYLRDSSEIALRAAAYLEKHGS